MRNILADHNRSDAIAHERLGIQLWVAALIFDRGITLH